MPSPGGAVGEQRRRRALGRWALRWERQLCRQRPGMGKKRAPGPVMAWQSHVTSGAPHDLLEPRLWSAPTPWGQCHPFDCECWIVAQSGVHGPWSQLGFCFSERLPSICPGPAAAWPWVSTALCLASPKAGNEAQLRGHSEATVRPECPGGPRSCLLFISVQGPAAQSHPRGQRPRPDGAWGQGCLPPTAHSSLASWSPRAGGAERGQGRLRGRRGSGTGGGCQATTSASAASLHMGRIGPGFQSVCLATGGRCLHSGPWAGAQVPFLHGSRGGVQGRALGRVEPTQALLARQGTS